MSQDYELDRLVSMLYPCHKKHKENLFFEDKKDYYSCPKSTNLKEICEWRNSRLIYFLLNLN